MGKYGSMALGSEISGVSEELGDVLEQLPKTINDMIDQIDTASLRKSVEGIKTGIEGIVESIDTARLRKSIEGLTQNIDTAKLRQKLEAVVKILSGEE